MKNLIKNYIDKLSIDNLKEFSLKNDINLTNSELEYILNLVKNNYEDILIDDSIYLKNIKEKINSKEYIKLENLYFIYKNKYKKYLF